MADNSSIELNAELRLTNTQKFEAQIRDLEKRSSINLRVSDSQPLGRLTTQVSEFSKSMDAANARVVAFGASAVIIGGVTQAIRSMITSSIDLGKRLNEINIFLKQSDSTLNSFGSSLFDIAKNTGSTFDDVSKAAKEFSRQNTSVSEVLRKTSDAMVLARLSGISFGEAVESLTAQTQSFQREGLSTTDIINKIAAVSGKFAISSKDLSEALSHVGSAVDNSKISFNELTAIIATTQQKTGRDGTAIANALTNIFNRVGKSDTLNQLEQMGIAVRDTAGKTLPLIDILSSLSRSYDTLGDTQKSFISDIAGGVRGLAVLRAGLSDISKENSVYSRALKTASDATNEAISQNDQYNKSLAALANSAEQNFTKLAASSGKLVFTPVLEKLFGNFNEFADGASGNSIGAKIGQGILAGIGNVLSGPGLILGGTLAAKLLGNFIGFSTEALGNIAGIGKASQEVQNVQKGIEELLRQDVSLREIIENKAISLADKEELVLSKIRLQIEAKQEYALLTEQLAAASVEEGARFSTRGNGFKINEAGGFIPRGAVNNEINGARHAGYSISAGDVRQMDAKINGRLTRVVYNTKEKVIPNFGGSGEPAIIPPTYAEGYEPFGDTRALLGNFKIGQLPKSVDALHSIGSFLKRNVGLNSKQRAPFIFNSGEGEDLAQYIPENNLISIHHNEIATQIASKHFPNLTFREVLGRSDFKPLVDTKIANVIAHEGFHNAFAQAPRNTVRQFNSLSDRFVKNLDTKEKALKFVAKSYFSGDIEKAKSVYGGYAQEEAMAIQFPRLLGFAGGHIPTINAAKGIEASYDDDFLNRTTNKSVLKQLATDFGINVKDGSSSDEIRESIKDFQKARARPQSSTPYSPISPEDEKKFLTDLIHRGNPNLQSVDYTQFPLSKLRRIAKQYTGHSAFISGPSQDALLVAEEANPSLSNITQRTADLGQARNNDTFYSSPTQNYIRNEKKRSSGGFDLKNRQFESSDPIAIQQELDRFQRIERAQAQKRALITSGGGNRRGPTYTGPKDIPYPNPVYDPYDDSNVSFADNSKFDYSSVPYGPAEEPRSLRSSFKNISAKSLFSFKNPATQARVSGVGLTAAFALPALGGFAAQAAGEGHSQFGRGISESTNAIGTGLAIGSLFGPVGIAVGGLIGVFGTLKAIIGNLNPSFEDFQRKLKVAQDIRRTQSGALESFATANSQFNSLQGGGSTLDIKKSLVARQEAFSKLSTEDIRDLNGDFSAQNVARVQNSSQLRDTRQDSLDAVRGTIIESGDGHALGRFFKSFNPNEKLDEKVIGALVDSSKNKFNSKKIPFEEQQLKNALGISDKDEDRSLFSIRNSNKQTTALKQAGSALGLRSDSVQSLIEQRGLKATRKILEETFERLKTLSTNFAESTKTAEQYTVDYVKSLKDEAETLRTISEINFTQNLKSRLVSGFSQTRTSLLGQAIEGSAPLISDSSKSNLLYADKIRSINVERNLELSSADSNFNSGIGELLNKVKKGTLEGNTFSNNGGPFAKDDRSIVSELSDKFNQKNKLEGTDVDSLRGIFSSQVYLHEKDPARVNQFQDYLNTLEELSQKQKSQIGSVEALTTQNLITAKNEKELADQLLKQKQLASLFDFSKLLSGPKDVSSINSANIANQKIFQFDRSQGAYGQRTDFRGTSTKGLIARGLETQDLLISQGSSLAAEYEAGHLLKRDQIRSLNLGSQGPGLDGNPIAFSPADIELSRNNQKLAQGFTAAKNRDIQNTTSTLASNFIQNYNSSGFGGGGGISPDFQRQITNAAQSGNLEELTKLVSGSISTQGNGVRRQLSSQFLTSIEQQQAQRRELPDQAKNYATAIQGGADIKPLTEATFVSETGKLLTAFTTFINDKSTVKSSPIDARTNVYITSTATPQDLSKQLIDDLNTKLNKLTQTVSQLSAFASKNGNRPAPVTQ